MKIKIAHLYYDLLNLYGEQGNILALEKHFNNQNIETEIDYLSTNDKIDFKKYDIYYIGSGSKENLLITLKDIMKYQKDIKTAIEKSKYFIATGNSHELFGKNLTYDNITYEGLNIFEYYSKENDNRITGECFMKFNDIKNPIIGFQNRASVMQINDNHLFEVITGNADNFKSSYEGYTKYNFFGTYLIGPLLIRNPHFTDYIVSKILKENKLKFHKDKSSYEYKAYYEYIKNFYEK